MKYLSVGLACLMATSLLAQTKNSIATASQITNATVYYGYGAELTHKAKATVPAGQYEVVVSNISTTAQQNTLQIACPENVVLLSYNLAIKNDAPIVVSNPMIKKIEDSIKLSYKQIAGIQSESSVQEELLQKTAKIIEGYASAPDKTTNTTDILKMVDFYNTKIQTYRTAIYTLRIKKEDIQEQISGMQTRINELKQKEKPIEYKSTAELVLQVLTKETTNAEFGISYFTPNAGWVPTYDIRVKSIDNSFKLGYKAAVTQSTGLDWKQVKLNLSTSNPNQGTTIPILTAWQLQYYVPAVYKKMLQGRTAGVNVLTNSVQGYYLKDADKENDEKLEKSIDPSDISSYTNLNESQLFTSFVIDLPYDIPSNGKSYSVAIKEEKIKASYKHYAVPKLDRDAFLLAEISDWENLDLLPGDANVIMDNVYIGKTFIDPNSTQDTLNLSLGRDKRIAIKRMLIKEQSKSRLIGTNKSETFTYEITVKNNKKEAVNMLLKDQYPLSNIKEIEVSLENTNDAEVNEEIGVLNWKIKLQPGESRKYRFTYTVKYPKDKKIGNLR